MNNRLDSIIEKAKERYSNDFWRYHILPVVKNSALLVKQISKADYRIVEMAAYLHDLARFLTPKQLGLEKDHHIIGAQMANELLLENNYNPLFIEQVEHCILTHRGKKGPAPQIIEAKIVACADAMAHFDTFPYVFKLFLDTCVTFEEALEGVHRKLLRDWRKLVLPQARHIAESQFNAIMLILRIMDDYKRENIEV